jgi:hypothetical protein
MNEIVRAERVSDGILLTVKTPEGNENVTFSFSDLIDREINAFHLLEAPYKYLCDPRARTIARKQRKM